MNFQTSSVLRQAVAVAAVVAGCATSQEAPETYAWAPVRPPAVPGTGLPTPGQPGQVRPQPLPQSPHTRVLPPTREPGLWAGDAPGAAQQPEAAPTPERSRGNKRAPPAPVPLERRPECQPIPVPHAGGDDAHNACADQFPPNRYPGMDVLVDGARFDALQVGVRRLWEIKTNKFDTYPAFVQEREIEKEMEQIRKERKAAAACGYGFIDWGEHPSAQRRAAGTGSVPQYRRHGVQTMTYAKKPRHHRLRACAGGQRPPHARYRPWDGKGAPRLAPGVAALRRRAPHRIASARCVARRKDAGREIPYPVQRGRELPRDG